MKKNIIIEFIYWTLIIVQIVLGLLVFKQSNWEKVYLINLLIPSIGFWLHEKRNLKKEDEFYIIKRKKFRIFRISMTVLMSIVVLVIYLKTFKYITLDQSVIMKYFISIISILIILFGNLISNIRPNGFLGINNYFTNKNYEVWKVANRWSGKLFVFTGILSLIINSFTPHNQLIFNYLERIYYFIILSVFCTLCPFLYSWITYVRFKKKEIIE